jgi:hypothetical protein
MPEALDRGFYPPSPVLPAPIQPSDASPPHLAAGPSKPRKQLNTDVLIATDANAVVTAIQDILTMGRAIHQGIMKGSGGQVAFDKVFAGISEFAAGFDHAPNRIPTRPGIFMGKAMIPHQVSGSQVGFASQAVVPPERPVFTVHQLVELSGRISIKGFIHV